VNRATTRALILVPALLLVLVVLFFLLRPDSPAPESSAESATANGPREETFDLAIEEGTMTPAEISVEEGDRVNLRITSDRPVELHLHGYDLEEEIEPGEPAELSFDATISGRFEIEDHNADAVLGVLLVQPR
jgi:FtsP/CotA-like multicopper oxidase with cupredoxin domain